METTLDKIIQFVESSDFDLLRKTQNLDGLLFSYHNSKDDISISIQKFVNMKKFITMQMPCGCPVGTHSPDERDHPANPCIQYEGEV